MAFKNGGVQSVQSTAAVLNVIPERLYFNYRLTKENAKLAEKVGKVDDLVLSCKRNGEKPNLVNASSYDVQLDKIAEIIKNRNLTNVGILLRHNTIEKGGQMSVEYVKDYLLRKGVSCEYKYTDTQTTSMDLDFHSTNPKIMTWWCGKGLQFKDVFIPGCEFEYDADLRAAFYVAITRCSERLHLCYSNRLNSFLPSETSNLYKSTSTVERI